MGLREAQLGEVMQPWLARPGWRDSAPGLGRWHIADWSHQPTMIEPVIPFKRCELDASNDF